MSHRHALNFFEGSQVLSGSLQLPRTSGPRMSVLQEQGCTSHNRSRHETYSIDSDTRDLHAVILFLYGRNIRRKMAVERMLLHHDVVVKPQSLKS